PRPCWHVLELHPRLFDGKDAHPPVGFLEEYPLQAIANPVPTLGEERLTTGPLDPEHNRQLGLRLLCRRDRKVEGDRPAERVGGRVPSVGNAQIGRVESGPRRLSRDRAESNRHRDEGQDHTAKQHRTPPAPRLPPNAKAKLPGPPARTLKLGKPGWRPRSASAVWLCGGPFHKDSNSRRV